MRVLMTVVAVLGGLCFVAAQHAEAQIIAISTSGYVAGPPPKANPAGTFSVGTGGIY